MEPAVTNPSEGVTDVDSAAAFLTNSLLKKREQKPAETTAKPEGKEPKAEEPKGTKPEPTDTDPGDEAPAKADTAEKPDGEGGEPESELAIEVDGEKLTAKQIRELRKERMLHADYTRKTQSLAEQRKAVEAKAAEIETARTQQLSQLGFLANTLAQQITHIEQHTNWDELRQKDPAGFVQAREAIAARQNALRQAYGAYQQIEASKQQETQAQRQKRLAQEAELLPTRIPDWADEKTAERERSDLAAYLEKDGFGKEDESLLENHKAIALFRKAMLYDRSQADLAKAKAKAEKPVPKVTKGGVASSDAKDHELQQAQERLRKSGRAEDAMKLLALKQRKN